MQEEEKAPFYPIGNQAFQSVEYPGSVGPSSLSLDKALRSIGKPEDWNSVFNKTKSNLELRLRPDDHWAHPVAGDRTTTHRVLLKVTRRRRRRSDQFQGEQLAGGNAVPLEKGVYKVEVAGTVKQTVRYRGTLVASGPTIEPLLRRFH
jgi:general transcription factor 3C polypeptide 5 (transcription factor C subunit 1)